MATYTGIAMLAKAFNGRQAHRAGQGGIRDGRHEGQEPERRSRDARHDHQLQQPLYIATWTKVNGKDVKYDQENTGYGWKTDQKIDAFVAAQPTSCQMKRPAGQ